MLIIQLTAVGDLESMPKMTFLSTAFVDKLPKTMKFQKFDLDINGQGLMVLLMFDNLISLVDMQMRTENSASMFRHYRVTSKSEPLQKFNVEIKRQGN